MQPHCSLARLEREGTLRKAYSNAPVMTVIVASLPLQVNLSKQCPRELCGGTRGKPRNRANTLYILHFKLCAPIWRYWRRRLSYALAAFWIRRDDQEVGGVGCICWGTMRLTKTWTKRGRLQKNSMALFILRRESQLKIHPSFYRNAQWCSRSWYEKSTRAIRTNLFHDIYCRNKDDFLHVKVIFIRSSSEGHQWKSPSYIESHLCSYSIYHEKYWWNNSFRGISK